MDAIREHYLPRLVRELRQLEAAVANPNTTGLERLEGHAARVDAGEHSPFTEAVRQAVELGQQLDVQRGMTLKDWVKGVQDGFPFAEWLQEGWWVWELTTLAELLDARWHDNEVEELGGAFCGWAESVRGVHDSPPQLAVLDHFDLVWSLFDDLRVIPDLPFLLLLKLDEAKCEAARRIEAHARSSRMLLVGHLDPLRERLARLTDRLGEAVRLAWLVCPERTPTRPLPQLPSLSETEKEILQALARFEIKQERPTGEQLAAVVGCNCNSNFKQALSALRKRGFLGNAKPGYYRMPGVPFPKDQS